MSIAGVQSWTLTPADNISINGISVAEMCPAANINNSIRQIMSSVMQELAYQGADISSSASISLAGVDYRFAAITGSSSIIHAGTGRAGLVRVTKWNSASTLVGNAFVLTDGGGNIVTATNDVTMFLSFGSGVNRAIHFPISGLSPGLVGSVTSSASIGDSVFGLSGAGVVKRIPASVTASAGSLVVWDAGPKYPAGDGSQITGISGTKVYTGSYATNADLTTGIPLDDTVPTSSEGTQIISVGSVVTTTTTQRVRGTFAGMCSGTINQTPIAAIYRGSTCIQVGIAVSIPVGIGTSKAYSTWSVEFNDAPGAGGTYTYSVRVGPDSATGGTLRMNGSDSARFFGGAMKAVLDLEVYEP